MDRKQGRGVRRWWLVCAAAATLILAALVTSLIYCAVRVDSGACGAGPREWDECRNATHLLQLQLTRAQDSLLHAETQASSCNQTVVSLQDSLKKKVSQAAVQQTRIRELENELMKLNEQLEMLRKEKEASRTQQENYASSPVVFTVLVIAVPLILMLF